MSRATPDDQLKFLLSCVRHSNNGKIDFIEVAGECGVVSKGAAAKRYERLLKANGIHPNGGPSERPAASTPKQKSKAEISKSADAKRRKLEGDIFSFKTDDEDETKPYFKPEQIETTHIKAEPVSGHNAYAWLPMSAPPQQPFFPRHPVSHINISSPHTLVYPPTYQNPMNQYSLQPSQPTHRTAPQAIALPRRSMVSPLQNEIRPSPPSHQPPPAVSEEQINTIFEEFCSQDMFKQPNFDVEPPAKAPISDSNSSIAALTSESDLSPRTVDFPDTAQSEKRLLPPRVTGEVTPDVATTAIASTVILERPPGSRIEDSILIAD